MIQAVREGSLNALEVRHSLNTCLVTQVKSDDVYSWAKKVCHAQLFLVCRHDFVTFKNGEIFYF